MEQDHAPAHEDPMAPLQRKVELLRRSVDETQKYELLTTNQYLQQMELVIQILEDVSLRSEPRLGAKNRGASG